MEFKKLSAGTYIAKKGPLEVHVFAGLDDWDLLVQRQIRIGSLKWLVQMRLGKDYPTPEEAMAEAEKLVPPLLDEVSLVLEEARTGTPRKKPSRRSALTRVAGEDPV